MILYRIGTFAYHWGIRLAALLGNTKADAWVAGRKHLGASQLKAATPSFLQARKPGQPLLWLHAASLGEFEQGRPVLELLREHWPQHFFLLTFYSPSGYEAAKNYAGVDAVSYLPADEPAVAKAWVKVVQPAVAIFVKYEFWLFHLAALRSAGVPTFLIAATFRPKQPFFRWYGGSWRKALQGFSSLLVQKPADAKQLKQLDIDQNKVIVSGDPRIDRVLSIAATPFDDPILAHFTAEHTTFMAASVWPEDVALLADLLPHLPKSWRLILVPHQLDEQQIEQWTQQLGAVRYSRFQLNSHLHTSVLLMDTMGLLSRAYRYTQLAYVGGGFGEGIHNTLEPMAYWLPVVFGPKYHKFPEATETLASGGSFTVRNSQELIAVFKALQNPLDYSLASKNIKTYTQASKGAARKTASAIIAAVEGE